MNYKYKPIKFYIVCFVFTWAFWFLAAYINNTGNEGLALAFMILGLFIPAAFVSLGFVLLSRSKALKTDYKNKIIGFYKIN